MNLNSILEALGAPGLMAGGGGLAGHAIGDTLDAPRRAVTNLFAGPPGRRTADQDRAAWAARVASLVGLGGSAATESQGLGIPDTPPLSLLGATAGGLGRPDSSEEPGIGLGTRLLRALPGLGGLAAGGAAAFIPGLGAAASPLIGSLVGGGLQSLSETIDPETFKAPSVEDLSGSDSPLVNFAAGAALDPLTYTGIGGGLRASGVARGLGGLGREEAAYRLAQPHLAQTAAADLGIEQAARSADQIAQARHAAQAESAQRAYPGAVQSAQDAHQQALADFARAQDAARQEAISKRAISLGGVQAQPEEFLSQLKGYQGGGESPLIDSLLGSGDFRRVANRPDSLMGEGLQSLGYGRPLGDRGMIAATGSLPENLMRMRGQNLTNAGLSSPVPGIFPQGPFAELEAAAGRPLSVPQMTPPSLQLPSPPVAGPAPVPTQLAPRRSVQEALAGLPPEQQEMVKAQLLRSFPPTTEGSLGNLRTPGMDVLNQPAETMAGRMAQELGGGIQGRRTALLRQLGIPQVRGLLGI